MKVLYTVEATATCGRAGHVRSDDGVLDADRGNIDVTIVVNNAPEVS